MAHESNWSNTHTFKAVRLHRPKTTDELRHIVAGASKAHALGARHSFNGVADTTGDLLDLSSIDPAIKLDEAASTVSAGAGTNYGLLAQYLQAHGFALHNMASLPHLSLAGAVATGTHGSGDKSVSLAAAVAGIEFVTAEGDVAVRRRGDADFDGMVVSLGALGVATRITLDVEPGYDMRQDAFAGLAWPALFEHFDAVMAAGDSVSLLTKWSGDTVGRVWLKKRLAPNEEAAASIPWAAATPQAIEIEDETIASQLTLFGARGPWSERLPHYRPDVAIAPSEQIQSEYMVARGAALPALTRLKGIGERMDPHLYATEIRTVAGDALWLSPTYGHDCVAFHFTWKKDMEAVHALTAEIEDMLLPLGARPHWGKLMHARAARLAPLYPRLQDFRELAQTWDPKGKFRNEFLERHVFG